MKLIIFLCPLALFVMFACLKLFLPNTYASLIQEDSITEYLQAVCYLTSSMLACVLSSRLRTSRLFLSAILYGVLACGLLFIALEEISWGQRLFDVDTPEYFERHNIQKEVSLHNLETIQSRLPEVYMLVGAFGTFAWAVLAALPPRSGTRFRQILGSVVPEWYLSTYFFFVCFIYAVLEYVSPPRPGTFLVWRDQEPAELLLALGFLAFVTTRLRQLPRRVTRGTA